jgi:5-methylcytosine-specific restriction endonuclease McrA
MSDCNKHPNYVFSMTSMSCPECQPAAPARSKPYTLKQRARLDAAGNAARIDDVSGHAWGKIRLRIRQRDNYQCQSCKIAVNTGVVDHRVALVNGGSNADSNLQLLCTVCHNEKTALDQGHKVRTGVDATGMPTSKSHHWNI